MSGDYNLKLSIRNERILRAIRDLDYRSVAEFCRHMELNTNVINALVCFRTLPISNGKMRQCATDLCAALGLLPEDLWTETQLELRWERNTFERTVDEDDMQRISNREMVAHLLADPKLNKREIAVLQMRMVHGKTLEECGAAFDVTGNRIMQIEKKAIRKLRHRAHVLKLESPDDCGVIKPPKRKPQPGEYEYWANQHGYISKAGA